VNIPKGRLVIWRIGGEKMLVFIQTYWLDTLVSLIIIGGLSYLYKIGKKETVRKIILALVIQAEKALGSNTGELKYTMVVERLYELSPFLLKLLVTKKEIDNMIEDAVIFMKNYLAEGRTLLGYDEEYRTSKNI